MKAKAPFGPGLSQRVVRITDGAVVELRAIIEAYDGLAMLYGDGSGRVVLATTDSQASELDALLAELCRELPLSPCG